MRFFLIIVLSFSLSAAGVGQDSIVKNKFSPALILSVGYLPKTYPIAPKSPACGLVGAEFFWNFTGKDLWHQYYHFPRGGFELVYAQLGNQQELGSAIGIIPALEWQTTNRNSKWRFKIGIGVSYFNKTFDPIDNQNNYYIGTHFVNMTHLSLSREARLSNKLVLRYGLSAIHSSDGHTALPNVGLNMLTADVVLNFATQQKNKTTLDVNEKRNNFYTVKFGIGMHELGETEKPVGGPSYPSYHLSGWYNRSFKQIHILQVGFVAGYYTGFYDYIVNHEVYASNQNLKSGTGVLFFGHEYVFGKFGIATHAGIYVYNPFYIKQAKIEGTWDNTSDKLEAFITNRLGLNYYPFKKANSLNNIKNQFSLGVFIKTNLAQADLFEYAMSFTF